VNSFRLEEPLWLIAVLPVLIAAAARAAGWTGEDAALRFPGGASLKPSKPGLRAIASRWAGPILKTIAALLFVAALARPQSIQRTFAGPTEGIDILLALDTSDSMKAIDFDPLDRMTAAKNAAADFIRGRITDRIGIVVFGGAPMLTCPLTLDHEALLDYLGGVATGITRAPGTAIGDGLASAVNHLKESEADSRVIVLLTDGKSNSGLVDPLTAAKAAATFGIKVYTIGTATRGPAFVRVQTPFGPRMHRIQDELDEDTLVKIAAETGGMYFRATDLKELADVYSRIDELEKTEYERPEIVTYDDLFAPLLWLACLLLAVEMTLTRTWLLRIP